MDNILRFTKMHGIGNDYIYFDCTRGEERSGIPTDVLTDNSRLGRLSEILSDRHTGVGGDGIILILPSEIADFTMRIFNADGSEAKMCGNGIRCVGKYIFDHGLATNPHLTLETLSGVKFLDLYPAADGKIATVKVDMGAPVLTPADIPVSAPGHTDGMNLRAEVNGNTYCVNAVSMGNPHGVIFTEEITDAMVLGDGPQLERHPMWPDRANIEFVRPTGAHSVDMRVWERGSGETMACGTGACATAVAAVAAGRCQWPVEVKLLGGTLKIDRDPATGHILMEGPATEVFQGTMPMPEI